MGATLDTKIIIGVVLIAAMGLNKPPSRTSEPLPAPLIILEAENELISYAKRHEIDPRLVAAIIKTESDWNPKAKGTSGELGLMQLMEKTANYFKVKDRSDPVENIKGGIQFLAYCKQKTGKAFIRCYNAGEFKTEITAAKTYEKKVLAAYQVIIKKGA